ncbi:MAG: hypothetical protein K2N87_06030 [Eubacterium sp.]|nr:hypothetical protein [Eubacterium sp.]
MKAKKRIITTVICFLLLLAGISLRAPKQAAAASDVLDLKQIQQTFAQAIKKGKQSVTFTAPASYSTAQIKNALEQAAKSQNRMLAGSVQFRKQTNSASTNAKYTVELSKDAFIKVKRLKSEAAARKAAAKALKDRDYSESYYSDTSYYEIFVKMLQQHPEYNYNTVVWRNTGGAYGYQVGRSLTKEQQDEKVNAADKAAQDAVKKCIKSGMSGKQKAKAIHDYLILNCTYDKKAAEILGNKYDDAFTAYGALVEGSAVCQGYAAAFNLMAKKCGLQSMSVCGTAGGVAHAWTYAKLGSKYSYIDCTWDDPDDGDEIRNDYFAVSEKKMREQHVWTEADFPKEDIKYSKYF